jgi:hypothetical protein
MNEDRATLLFARLAAVSAERGQTAGRNRFLILAGIAATHAGWPAVAARCHHLVTTSAPRHLLGRYASFAEALRDPDFEQFCRQLRRFCSPERAEHLLSELGLEPGRDADSPDAAAHALQILQRMD